jgi:dihydroxyacetone kinase
MNDPLAFRDDSRRGMVLAHPDLLAEVRGGVVAAAEPAEPKVAVVIGGGSGHYPAFAGLVGPGLADGAAMGDVFASPSARAVESVARAVDTGRGVLLTFGNYAGDVMNFERAAGLLRDSGVAVEVVPVTDDVASAPAEQASTRRGIAGDLIVFKIAGAAAAAGADLAEVTRVTRAAVDATRTVGVAYGGTTLPGATEPLFSVPAGQMVLGMGIHGEPGLETLPVESAQDLARRLWDRLEPEVPVRDGDRLVVLVNGLGAVKGEELYLFYGALHDVLAAEGRTVAEAHVGEFATSFEMPGLSVTVAALDEELYGLWSASARSAAFSRGGDVATAGPRRVVGDESAGAVESGDGSGEAVVTVFERIVAVIEENEHALGTLDAAAGDGDHGIGMSRGARGALSGARAAAETGASASATLFAAGDAWEDAAGGTSGAIWGAVWRAVAGRLGALADLGPEKVTELLDTMWDAVCSFGAAPGDRTIVDAARGLIDGWAAAPADLTLTVRWLTAVQAATDAAAATAAMVPRRGRAKTHATKKIETPDAGAVSFALVAGALVEV